MSFSRADFYGLDFDWYACDSAGCLARFTTGFGPLPRKLFTDEDAYRAIADFFRSAPSVSESRLSKLAQTQQERGVGNYSQFLADASRGLFILSEQDYGPIHRLYASPASALSLASLPASVQKLVSKFCLTGLVFADADTVNVLEYFDCVS
jgi:hypothetical protein